MKNGNKLWNFYIGHGVFQSLLSNFCFFADVKKIGLVSESPHSFYLLHKMLRTQNREGAKNSGGKTAGLVASR